MFEFTIKENILLNDFLRAFSTYVNKAYKYTTTFLATPQLTDIQDSERLILLSINKSAFQNMYSFLHLNESNFQYAAFSCLESAVYAMRLYTVLAGSVEYMTNYITAEDFSLEVCEAEIQAMQSETPENSEEFSLIGFCEGLHKLNTFRLKNSSVSSQIVDSNIYLGISCGNRLSDDLQHEIRKNLIGAFLSLFKHTAQFKQNNKNEELEELEKELFEKFTRYVKNYS